jgi:hypothetical protein
MVLRRVSPHGGDGRDGERDDDGRAEGPSLLATYRRTRRQAMGRGLFVGGLIGVVLFLAGVVVVVARAAMTGGTWPHESLVLFGLLLIPAAIGTSVGVVSGVRTGVDADELGIHSVPPLPRSFGPWSSIADIRAERRRSKTIVAVYLESGRVLRLRAPYDGQMLGHDPRFERKYFMLVTLWETHRSHRSRT